MIENIIYVSKKKYKLLPSVNGVYFFFQKEKILYIGKSNNLRARITTHFKSSNIDRKEGLIIGQTDRLGYIVTDSEFNALILEARLINQFQPKYNVIWKDDKSHLYIKINTDDPYPKIILVRKEETKTKKADYFGPFSSVRTVEEILREIRKIFPFCQQKKLGRRPCFYSKIGLCNPCPSNIEKEEDSVRVQLKKIYRHNIFKVIKILQGKSKIVEKSLEQEIKLLSKTTDYEKAINYRNKLVNLKNLLKHHLPEKNIYYSNRSKLKLANLSDNLKKYFLQIKSLKRIEAYDVSNLSFRETTASMVVFTNGIADKGLYRRFKIKENRVQSDFFYLLEALRRRMHHNWPKPDLIIVDGGKPQLSIISNFFIKENIKIPLIGIAKNPDRIIAAVDNWPKVFFKADDPGFLLIREVRDEAHRFARKYHLFLRKHNYKY